MNTKCWWFQEHLSDDVIIKEILSEDNVSDLFTKSTKTAVFVKLRKLLLGWQLLPFTDAMRGSVRLRGC